MTELKSQNPQDFDVIIIGGGPAGGLTACALAQSGLNVAMVEANDPAQLAKPGTDGRSIAMALSAQRVFKGAGTWGFMEAEAQPILDIRITDQDSPLSTHFNHKDVGDEPFGWIVENTTIRGGVYKRLAELDSAHVFAPTRVVKTTRDAKGVSATLADGRVLTAKLIIAADGRPSPTRVEAGIKVTILPYNQSGIVTTVRHEKPHFGIAHERFLSSGPFAILPMTGNRSSIVWTERLHLADAIVNQSDEAFLAEMKHRFGDFLGDVQLDSPRYHYPLTLQVAERSTDLRLALVGDAAHGMHPIAGQGMNMGIRDVAALVEHIVDAHRAGRDIGGEDVLKGYEQWRNFDNLLMLGVTDFLVRLFSTDIAPLRIPRRLGLGIVEALPFAKKLFMRHAMGVVGELPRMLRNEPL